MKTKILLLLMLTMGALRADVLPLPFADGEWRVDAASRTATVRSGDSVFTVVFRVSADLTDVPIREKSQGVYANGLRLKSDSHVRSGALLWSFRFTNPTSKELCFEPSLRVASPGADGKFWDGYETRSLNAAPFNRTTLLNTYPVACVLLDSVSLGFGLTPSPRTSYLESGVTADRIAYYATRIALPPKQECEITFVVFPFRGGYSEYDAMGRYQGLFPEAFSYVPGVDERLVNGQFTDSHCEGILTGAIDSPVKVKYCGQGRIGLSWAYAYYRKQGDFYGHSDLWEDLSPETPQRRAGRQSKTANELNILDRESMHRERRSRFRANDFRGNTLNGFYIFNTIDRDVIIRNRYQKYVYPLVKGQSPYQGWALGYDISGHMFAWASPLEKVYRRDIPLLFAENEMSAIAYDGFIDIDKPTSIGQCDVYRGELDYYIPGWSYDKNGRFIRNSRYLQEHCDYFHSLKKGDRTLGVWSNTWFANPLVAFKPDAYLYENFDPSRLYGEMYEMFNRGLCFRGHRPAYMHNIDYDTQLSRYLVWEKMTPRQLRLAAEDYVRDEISLFYQCNLLPVWKLVLSHRDIYAEMPYLVELSERGHYPPCPVRGGGNLDKVRYGEGLDGLLVLINRDRAPVTVTQVIDNGYFGDFSVLPFWYRGGRKLESILRGAETEFSCGLALRENALISTPVGISFAQGVQVKAETSMVNDPYEKVLSAILVADKNTEAVIHFQADRHYVCHQAVWNGAPISSGMKVSLVAGKPMDLRIVLRSELFLDPVSILMEFDFSQAVVVIPSDADDRLSGCAQMIDDNLRCGLGNAGARILTSIPPGKPAIVLSRGKEGIWIEDGKLIVSGRDSFRIQQNAWQMLRLIDRYHPDVDISWGKIFETDAFRQAMEDGQQLPFAIKYHDETVNWKDYLKNNDETTSTVPFGYSLEVVVPRASVAPVVDGGLTDDIWKGAAILEDFRIVGSQESPKHKTSVRVLHDADNLYFSVLCYESNMSRIADRFTEHDSSLWEGDDFEIRLAPRIALDEKKPFPFFMFAFSPSGVQTDHLIVDHTVDADNAKRVLGVNWQELPSGSEWNGKWEVRTKIGPDSWTAEVVIPLKSINLSVGEDVRVLLGRGEKTVPEDSSWPLIFHGNFNNCSSFGVLKWGSGETDSQDLQIIRASYGSGDNGVDVTLTVRDFVSSGRDIPVNNGTFGCDPAPGAAKRLDVVYSLGGQTRTLSCPEQQEMLRSDLLALKGDESASSSPSRELQIIRASYGSGDNGVDVTLTVRDFVSSGRDIPVNNGTFGCDPAPGAAKRLDVVYSLGGQTRTLSCPEQQEMRYLDLR